VVSKLEPLANVLDERYDDLIVKVDEIAEKVL